MSHEQSITLRELEIIARRGAENASVALAAMLGRPLQVTITDVRHDRLDHLVEAIAPAESHVIGLVAAIHGDLDGRVAFLMPDEDAIGLIGQLDRRRAEDHPALDAFARSILQETANIGLSSFLNSLGAHIARTCMPGPTVFLHDLGGAIAATVLLQAAACGDHGMVFTSRLDDQGISRRCTLLFVPDPHAIPLLTQDLDHARGS